MQTNPLNSENQNSNTSQNVQFQMRENVTTQFAAGVDLQSPPPSTSFSVSTISGTPRRSPRREEQAGQIAPSPAQTDVNGITFQLNNAGKSICVPEATTARTIHFTNVESNEHENFVDEGYDSDGVLGPSFDAIVAEELIDDYVEQSIETFVPSEETRIEESRNQGAVRNEEIRNEEIRNEEIPIDTTNPPTTTADAPTVQEVSPQLTVDDIMTLKVKELIEELEKRRLSKIGLKQVLQERLKDAIVNNIPVLTAVAGSDTPADTIPNADDGWFPGSRWVPLTPEENELEDVTRNEFYSPTDASDSSPPP